MYVGYLDGVINVYGFSNTADGENLSLNASFNIHDDAIHSLHIINDLGFAISSGFDSSLKVWKPPQNWDKKFVVTQGMINGMNPKVNLSTIKEEYESHSDSLMIKKFTNSNLYDNQINFHPNAGNSKDFATGMNDLLEQNDEDD